jgi:hypothetical protein
MFCGVIRRAIYGEGLAAAGGGPEGPGLISVPMFIRQPEGPPIATMFIMLAFCWMPSA